MRKKTISQSKNRHVKDYTDSVPSMVKKWFNEVSCGHASTIVIARNCKIHGHIIWDSCSIVNNHYGMRKLSTRQVPRLRITKHKFNSLTTLKKCLFNRNPCKFLSGRWTHYNTTETKKKSKQGYSLVNRCRERQISTTMISTLK